MGEKLWVTGAQGMLGRAVMAEATSHQMDVVGTGREVDVTDENAVHAWVHQHKPTLVIHCAAYTAVDKAEAEEELAMRVNAHAAGVVARASHDVGAHMVHVSTDYVFDGTARKPLRSDDKTGPVSAYGRSKLMGEQRVHDATHGAASIVRTSWLYGPHGKNFVATMVALMHSRPVLRVVDDQVGRPTSTATLASGLLRIAHRRVAGVVHASDAGEATSWHGFACAIHDELKRRGEVLQVERIEPITTAAYPTPARRPPYSVFDLEDYAAIAGPLTAWPEALRTYMSDHRT
jgi:dTDP-4-dehydrorhamnose reductase